MKGDGSPDSGQKKIVGHVAMIQPGFILPLGIDGNIPVFPLGPETTLGRVPRDIREGGSRLARALSPADLQALRSPVLAIVSRAPDPNERTTDAILSLWMAHPCSFLVHPFVFLEEIDGKVMWADADFSGSALFSLPGDPPSHFLEKDLALAHRLASALAMAGGSVRIAANLLLASALSYSIPVAFLLQWMALEALFGTSESELSFRLRLNLTLFLAESESGAKDLFDRLRGLYALRSKLVHGTSLSLPPTDAKELRTFVLSTFQRVLLSEDLRREFSGKERTTYLESLYLSRRPWVKETGDGGAKA